MRGRMVAEKMDDNQRRMKMYLRLDSLSGRVIGGESVDWNC
jgi:hypothetical protein